MRSTESLRQRAAGAAAAAGGRSAATLFSRLESAGLRASMLKFWNS
jgi:hypothetical protein